MIQSCHRSILTTLDQRDIRVTAQRIRGLAGATPDPSPSLLSQAEALDRIATWSALFLRAEICEDPIARFYMYQSGGSIDGTVTVTSER